MTVLDRCIATVQQEPREGPVWDAYVQTLTRMCDGTYGNRTVVLLDAVPEIANLLLDAFAAGWATEDRLHRLRESVRAMQGGQNNGGDKP